MLFSPRFGLTDPMEEGPGLGHMSYPEEMTMVTGGIVICGLVRDGALKTPLSCS